MNVSLLKKFKIAEGVLIMKKSVYTILCLALFLIISSVSMAADFNGKKILFIDSYHEGYPWSDGIVKGVQQSLGGTGVNLKIIHMDTKRNKGDVFMNEAVQKAKAVIESFKPDVVIAADDNASKYLIKPFYKDASLPFVFCGVNWDASNYGFPYKNVTGMVEVAGAKELVDLLQKHAKGSRVALLADNTLSSQKDADNYKSKLNIDVTPVLVDSLEEWKKNYKEIQNKFDILLVGNTVGINDFNEQEAEAFALENAKLPSGAVQRALMSYAILGYLKVPEEQGEWSAKTALKILDGASPADISIVKNTQGSLVINTRILKKTGINLPYELIGNAEEVIE